jgi:hypothetical protein
MPKQGYDPMGGSNEGLHKHLASEDWAGDISRPRMKDWDGPHHVCTNHTSCDSSRLYCCFVNVATVLVYLCVWTIAWKLILFSFALQVKIKPYDGGCNLCVSFLARCGCEHGVS